MLEHFADPRALLAAGTTELTVLITSTSGHQQGEGRAHGWRAAAAAALDLYGDHTAVAFEALAAEVATDVRSLKAMFRPQLTSLPETLAHPDRVPTAA